MRYLRLRATGGSEACAAAGAGSDEAKYDVDAPIAWVPPAEAASASRVVPGPELFPATGTTPARLTMGSWPPVPLLLLLLPATACRVDRRTTVRTTVPPDFTGDGPAITALGVASDAAAAPDAAVRIKLDPVDDASVAIVPTVGTSRKRRCCACGWQLALCTWLGPPAAAAPQLAPQVLERRS